METNLFLRNTWYVAVSHNEIDRNLKSITILGEKIVIYRREDGLPVALEDACPHRKLPLSKGRLTDDTIECGYHGLTFDCTGACVKAPTQDRIPPTAKVHSYPVVERWGFVWIWMGNPNRAVEKKIIHIDNYDNPSWGKTATNTLTCACNYLYLVDNLLDPFHVKWIHRTSLVSKGVDKISSKMDTFNDRLIISRWMYNQDPPPFYAPLIQFDGKCDRLQHYEARYPSIAVNKSIFTPVGTGGPDKPYQDNTFISISYSFLTPVDENTTHYHWFQQRNSDPDSKEVNQSISDGLRKIFIEDKDVVEAVHNGMANKTTQNIDLGLDAGPLYFRRELERMINAEHDES